MPAVTPAERWFFYQDAAGLWKWARLDLLGNILAHSGTSFDTRAACIEHARQSGFDHRRHNVSPAALRECPLLQAHLRNPA